MDPRGDSQQADVVRRFYDAFHRQDLDAFVETLDPHVELQTQRGLRRGREEARVWATRNPHGELEQRLVIEELIERRNHVLALLRVQWWWKREDELAEEHPGAALFTFVDGRIARFQPFRDRGEARAAAGIEGGGE
jgi:ketosteroid isomerase-like protein